MTITEFADLIDRHLVVMYRPNFAPQMRWYAYIDDCEVMRGVGLLSETGNGSTPDGALRDYARLLSGKRIVFDAYGKRRQEYVVPQLGGV